MQTRTDDPIDAFGDVVEALRAMPEREPSADLADRVMAAVHREAVAERVSRRLHWFAAAGIAASLAAMAWLSFPGLRPSGGVSASQAASSESVGTAADWLASQQEADGTWTPSRLGGADGYRAALTGLAAMALVQDGSKDRVDAARRAASALAAMQREDGSFAPPGISQLYNQGIATRAIFRIREVTGSGEWDDSLRAAVAFIAGRQSAAGGWDYSSGDSGNTALTIWQLDALAQARAAGWGDPQGSLRRGLRWLGSRVGADGSVSYREGGGVSSGSSTLSAMGAWGLTEFGSDFASLAPVAARAMERLAEAGDVTGIEPSKNLYRDLFVMRAFRAGNRGEAGDVAARMAAVREKGGDRAGAWRADGDPWNRAGGDLYATSVALLALAGPQG